MRTVAVAILVLASMPALAWNKPGHMVIGAMAYDVLKADNPQALATALALLRLYPQYADVISKRLKGAPFPRATVRAGGPPFTQDGRVAVVKLRSSCPLTSD
jgi:hypothetical protein